ncbi:hypothetical protein [Lacunimicrobium album]
MPDLAKTKFNLFAFIGLCFGGFALVVITAFAITPSERPESKSEKVIATFDGEGPGKTDFFTVDRGWEIRWETNTDQTLESIAWRTAEGRGSMIMKMHRKPLRMHGRVNVDMAGTFQLEINANGPWKMTVYQFQPK